MERLGRAVELSQEKFRETVNKSKKASGRIEVAKHRELNLHRQMPADVELTFYPSSPHSLAWSDDGELAIAAGEYIHLLVCTRSFVLSLAMRSHPV